MKVLLTGGLGYIGSHTYISLAQAGHEILVIDNLTNSNIEVINRLMNITQKNVAWKKIDVRDYKALKLVFEDFNPDAVMHFAGMKSVPESVKDPLIYYDVNVSGTIMLLKVMYECGVKTLVFSSSASIYGETKNTPISESEIFAPTSPYAKSKAIAEQILEDLAESDNEWSIGCLRYFNPLGAHKSGLIGESPKNIPNNLLPYIAQVAIGRQKILNIYGGDYNTLDGTGIRDYIHVVDLADGHLHALNYLSEMKGLLTLNLGNGNGYSVMQVLSAMQKVTKKLIPYEIVERRAGDVECSIADPTKAQKILNWHPKLDLIDMCSDAWRWQVMNPSGFDKPLGF